MVLGDYRLCYFSLRKKQVHKKKSSFFLNSWQQLLTQLVLFWGCVLGWGWGWPCLDSWCGPVQIHVIQLYIGSLEEWPLYLSVQKCYFSLIMKKPNYRVKAQIIYSVPPKKKSFLFQKTCLTCIHQLQKKAITHLTFMSKTVDLTDSYLQEL